MRGYYGIGIYHGKKEVNVGTLYRSAYCFGASFVFTIGRRYQRQASDTVDATQHIPLYEFATYEQMFNHIPSGSRVVAIEQGGHEVNGRCHPRKAIYLLGAEDHGLPEPIIQQCDEVWSIPTIEPNSLNVATAGSIIMYDRIAKSNSLRLAV